ncbi:uncharacterized protein [Amphiura filiformis]|uniref:uncharacterized protein n=1 Tax=Amphiura filiformis TaxID=82378 RepID=UPI003B2155F0
MNGVKNVNTIKLHGLEVADENGDNSIELPEAYIQDNIPVNTEDLVTQRDLEPWSYLCAIKVPEVKHKVELLIGNNVPQALEPIKVIHSQDGGPFASQTSLGWEIHGLIKRVTVPRESVHRICVLSSEDRADLNQKMTSMFNQDFSERSKEDMLEPSIEDQRFMGMVTESTRLVDGHYEIALPLRDRNKAMVDNRVQALKRAEHLKRKLDKNPQFKEDYKNFMEDVINSDYAERVPSEQLEVEDGKKWYVPHHGVYHPAKQKLRVVYDCAVTYKGCCLNDELIQGPDLTNTLLGVLLRFRQEPIALMADIQGMFSQVRVPRADMDYLLFLWWPGCITNQPLEEYRMKVHIFGATSSPACSNYALHRTVADNQQHYSKQACDTVRRNFYVDDCLQSVSTVSDGVCLAKDLISICAQGGFRLTKWISNNREVLESIPKEERAKEVKELNLECDTLPSERALGLQWQVEADTLGFKIAVKDRPVTRRGILSIVMLPAKKIIQDLCKLKLGWDEEIPLEHQKRWNQWLAELPILSTCSVSRCLKPAEFGKPTNIQLHNFSDASEFGYGVVAYMRLQNSSGETHTSLVMSKSRVAPTKQVSIPRLELTAATVAVRMSNMILREIEMPIDNIYFWTDSTTVLSYIANERTRYHTFVANRVGEIRENTKVSQWYYVPTKVNPADICSRGQSVKKFVDNTNWISGLEFLKDSETEWPVRDVHLQIEPDDPEVKKNMIVHAVQVDKPDEPYETFAQFFGHYSDYHKLKRAVAWLLRLKKLLSQRKTHQQTVTGTEESKGDEFTTKQDLTVQEIHDAEQAILRNEQHKYFAKEIKLLSNRNEVPTANKDKLDQESQGIKVHVTVQKSSPIYRLDPKLEDGLLRVGGRLRRAASLTEEAKYPVILPRNSYVSELILRQIHESTGHCGRNHMLANLQQHYWILGANSAARKLINRCIICRKQRAKRQVQKMADLPEDRLQPEEPPFTRVGIYFFGPVEVKHGRSILKRYGVVFTCLAIRAVHMEKADSLDTDSCIAAIRRFVARRGQVKIIRSDNGTNIVGAQRELSKEISQWNQKKIPNDLLQNNIEWKFNPPGASHFGGIWERQIRTIRKLMVMLSKEQTLSDESLQTLFCEVESIINSRPLTLVSGDAQDLEPLTPNHLLLLKTHQNLSPVFPENTDGTQQVNETMKSNINKEIARNQDQEDEEINHKAGETRLRSRPVKPRKILDL